MLVLRQNRYLIPKACLSGALTGLVNGIFGAGGGMVLIPLMTKLCGVDDRRAFASSIAVVLPICLSSLAVYALTGNLHAQNIWPYLLGGFLGGIAGGLVFRKIPTAFLHKALGVFILWGGLRLLLS